ncbi:MAG: hypothetical protein EOO41_00085, partial [Methanobacteriota archaeon]
MVALPHLATLHGSSSLIAQLASCMPHSLSEPVVAGDTQTLADSCLRLSWRLMETGRLYIGSAAVGGASPATLTAVTSHRAVTAPANSTAVLMQLASQAAFAEMYAACTRAAATVLSGCLARGAAWITLPSTWATLYALLATELLSHRRFVDAAGIGSAKDGSGAFLCTPTPLPSAVAVAATLTTSSSTASATGGGGSSSAGGDATPGSTPGKEDTDPGSAGVQHVRGCYTGLAAAWRWSAFAATASTLAACTRAMSYALPSSVAATRSLYRLTQLALSCINSVHVLPAGLRQYMTPAQLRGASGQAFDNAAATTCLRCMSGTSIMAAPNPPGSSGSGGAGSTPGASPHVHAVDAFVSAKPLSYDDSQVLSPYSVSLTAIVITRRSILNATASVLEAGAALPLSTLKTLPLRAPLLQAGTSVLTGGSIALAPMEMGLIALDDEPAVGLHGHEAGTAATLSSITAEMHSLSPQQVVALTPRIEAAVAATLRDVLAPEVQAWSPLVLALSHAKIPIVAPALWFAFDVPACLRQSVDGSMDAEDDVACGGGASCPPTLSALTKSTYMSALDTDAATMSQLATRAARSSLTHVAEAVTQPDGGVTLRECVLTPDTDLQMTRDALLACCTASSSSATPSACAPSDVWVQELLSATVGGGSHAQSAAASAPPSVFAPPPTSNTDMLSACMSDVLCHLFQKHVASPHADAVEGYDLTSSVSAGGARVEVRLATAALSVMTQLIPMLPIGQADALLQALTLPLRPAAGSVDTAAHHGFRYMAHVFTTWERAIVCRNVSALLMSILRTVRSEHVYAATATGSTGGGPVPWLLSIRSVLASGICHVDAVVRLTSAQALGEWVRLCGSTHGRKLVAALQRQMRGPEAAKLSPFAIGGAAYTLACIDRVARLSVTVDDDAAAHAEAHAAAATALASRREEEGAAPSTPLTQLFDTPAVHIDTVQAELMMELAQHARASVAIPALHGTRLMLASALDALTHARARVAAEPADTTIATACAACEDHLARLLLPVSQVVEHTILSGAGMGVDANDIAHTHLLPVIRTAPKTAAGGDPLAVTSDMTLLPREWTRFKLSSSLAGLGLMVQRPDAADVDAVRTAPFLLHSALFAAGASLPAGGTIVAALASSAGVPVAAGLDQVTQEFAEGVATALRSRNCTLLPVVDVCTGDCLPPLAAVGALMDMASASSGHVEPTSSEELTLANASAASWLPSADAVCAEVGGTPSSVLGAYRLGLRAAFNAAGHATSRLAAAAIAATLESSSNGFTDSMALSVDAHEAASAATQEEAAQLFLVWLRSQEAVGYAKHTAQHTAHATALRIWSMLSAASLASPTIAACCVAAADYVLRLTPAPSAEARSSTPASAADNSLADLFASPVVPPSAEPVLQTLRPLHVALCKAVLLGGGVVSGATHVRLTPFAQRSLAAVGSVEDALRTPYLPALLTPAASGTASASSAAVACAVQVNVGLWTSVLERLGMVWIPHKAWLSSGTSTFQSALQPAALAAAVACAAVPCSVGSTLLTEPLYAARGAGSLPTPASAAFDACDTLTARYSTSVARFHASAQYHALRHASSSAPPSVGLYMLHAQMRAEAAGGSGALHSVFLFTLSVAATYLHAYAASACNIDTSNAVTVSAGPVQDVLVAAHALAACAHSTCSSGTPALWVRPGRPSSLYEVARNVLAPTLLSQWCLARDVCSLPVLEAWWASMQQQLTVCAVAAGATLTPRAGVGHAKLRLGMLNVPTPHVAHIDAFSVCCDALTGTPSPSAWWRARVAEFKQAREAARVAAKAKAKRMQGDFGPSGLEEEEEEEAGGAAEGVNAGALLASMMHVPEPEPEAPPLSVPDFDVDAASMVVTAINSSKPAAALTALAWQASTAYGYDALSRAHVFVPWLQRAVASLPAIASPASAPMLMELLRLVRMSLEAVSPSADASALTGAPLEADALLDASVGGEMKRHAAAALPPPLHGVESSHTLGLVQLLHDICARLLPLPDVDVPSQPLLQQHQTLVVATLDLALRTTLTARVRTALVRLFARFVETGTVTDAVSIKRVTALIFESSSLSSTSRGSDDEVTAEEVDALCALLVS